MSELSSDLVRDDWAYDSPAFKFQLKDAIVNLDFSLEDYERVTGEDLDSKEDLICRLQGIWDIAFPGERVTD